jgi:hypothetical protein
MDNRVIYSLLQSSIISIRIKFSTSFRLMEFLNDLSEFRINLILDLVE